MKAYIYKPLDSIDHKDLLSLIFKNCNGEIANIVQSTNKNEVMRYFYISFEDMHCLRENLCETKIYMKLENKSEFEFKDFSLVWSDKRNPKFFLTGNNDIYILQRNYQFDMKIFFDGLKQYKTLDPLRNGKFHFSGWKVAIF